MSSNFDRDGLVFGARQYGVTVSRDLYLTNTGTLPIKLKRIFAPYARNTLSLEFVNLVSKIPRNKSDKVMRRGWAIMRNSLSFLKMHEEKFAEESLFIFQQRNAHEHSKQLALRQQLSEEVMMTPGAAGGFGTPMGVGSLGTPRLTPRGDGRKESHAIGLASGRRKTRRKMTKSHRKSRIASSMSDERSSRRGSLMDLGSSQRRNTRKSIVRQHSIVVADSHHSAASELNAAIEKRVLEWEQRSRQTGPVKVPVFGYLNPEEEEEEEADENENGNEGDDNARPLPQTMAAMRRRRSMAMEAKWAKEVDMHLPPLKAGHSWHFRIIYDGSKSKVAQLPLKTPFNVVYVPWQTDHILVDQQLGEIKFADLELLDDIRSGGAGSVRRQSSMLSMGSRSSLSRSNSIMLSARVSMRVSKRLSSARIDLRRSTTTQSRQLMLANALKVSSVAAEETDEALDNAILSIDTSGACVQKPLFLPTLYSFGPVAAMKYVAGSRGEAKPLMLRVVNPSIVPHTVTFKESTSPCFTVKQKNFAVPGGRFVDIPVTFKPRRENVEYTGRLLFGHQFGVTEIRLRGEGACAEIKITKPEMKTSGNFAVDFGLVRKGVSSSVPIKLQNSGRLPGAYELICEESNFGFEEALLGYTSGILDSEGTVEIRVFFHADNSEDLSYRGTALLRWQHAPGGTWTQEEIELYAGIGYTQFTSEPREINFGLTLLNRPSVRTIKVCNGGNAVCKWQIAEDESSHIVADPVEGILEPKGETEIQLSFTPSQVEPLYEHLRFLHDDGESKVFLSGTVGVPRLVTPDNMDHTFGVVKVGTNKAHKIELKNTGNMSVDFEVDIEFMSIKRKKDEDITGRIVQAWAGGRGRRASIAQNALAAVTEGGSSRDQGGGDQDQDQDGAYAIDEAARVTYIEGMCVGCSVFRIEPRKGTIQAHSQVEISLICEPLELKEEYVVRYFIVSSAEEKYDGVLRGVGGATKLRFDAIANASSISSEMAKKLDTAALLDPLDLVARIDDIVSQDKSSSLRKVRRKRRSRRGDRLDLVKNRTHYFGLCGVGRTAKFQSFFITNEGNVPSYYKIEMSDSWASSIGSNEDGGGDGSSAVGATTDDASKCFVVSPKEGYIEPGEEVNVVATFQAEGSGFYFAQLLVHAYETDAALSLEYRSAKRGAAAAAAAVEDQKEAGQDSKEPEITHELSNSGGVAKRTVTMFAKVGKPSLLCETKALDFGRCRVGQSLPQSIVLTSKGSFPVQFEISICDARSGETLLPPGPSFAGELSDAIAQAGVNVVPMDGIIAAQSELLVTISFCPALEEVVQYHRLLKISWPGEPINIPISGIAAAPKLVWSLHDFVEEEDDRDEAGEQDGGAGEDEEGQKQEEEAEKKEEAKQDSKGLQDLAAEKNPAHCAFGIVSIGHSRSKILTLLNDGTMDLTYELAVVVDGNDGNVTQTSAFVLERVVGTEVEVLSEEEKKKKREAQKETETGSEASLVVTTTTEKQITLACGFAHTYRICFQPEQLQAMSAVLSMITSDRDYEIACQGTGGEYTPILSKTSVNFGFIPVNGVSVQEVNLMNEGEIPAKIAFSCKGSESFENITRILITGAGNSPQDRVAAYEIASSSGMWDGLLTYGEAIRVLIYMRPEEATHHSGNLFLQPLDETGTEMEDDKISIISIEADGSKSQFRLDDENNANLPAILPGEKVSVQRSMINPSKSDMGFEVRLAPFREREGDGENLSEDEKERLAALWTFTADREGDLESDACEFGVLCE